MSPGEEISNKLRLRLVVEDLPVNRIVYVGEGGVEEHACYRK